MEHINFKWQRQILKSDLPPNGKYLMLTLSTYMDKDGECWPSIKALSVVTKLTENTVRKHIQLAIKKKLLRAENAGFRGAKSKQNKYYAAVVVKTLADELGYTTFEMRLILRNQFLGNRTVEVGGNKIEYLVSTSDLNVTEMEEFLTNVRVFFNDTMQIVIPLPNETPDQYE